ncbi:MAG: IS200/IS605 family transposase [Anaerolineales bacterium]|nr:IS200/IS605 family transposase [Anaerolineae bacterium]MBL6983788.1 IS200/IS605 family transposase [Anaerolineales bacterium]
MELKRTSHTVYETKYHLVWAPKYRKWILRDDVRERVEELFYEIAENHEIEIDALEIAEDHVHLFVSFPPRMSISNVVGKLKSITASVIFREHPEVKRELWGGHFWQVGYFVRTSGDQVTTEMIRNYIEYHKKEEKSLKQLKLF